MNFKIIEGGESEEFKQKFIEEYNKEENKVKDVCDALDISQGRYLRIKKELLAEGKIKEKGKRYRKGDGKYYTYVEKYDNYRITRTINGKTIHFMTVNTKDEAKFVVEKLKEYGWDKKNVNRIKKELINMLENEINIRGKTMTEEKKGKPKKEELIEGIIIDVDFGYGMKYADMENLFLKLTVQQFDGYECVQLFKVDKIGKLLLQFKGEYISEISLKHLQHRKVYLLSSDKTNGVPNAIAKLPPSQYPQYSWIPNDNWN